RALVRSVVIACRRRSAPPPDGGGWVGCPTMMSARLDCQDRALFRNWNELGGGTGLERGDQWAVGDQQARRSFALILVCAAKIGAEAKRRGDAVCRHVVAHRQAIGAAGQHEF